MWQTHCHMPTQMRSLAQRVISSLTYCRSPQSHQHAWLNSKGTLSLILLCKKWHISLLMGGQKAQECTPRSKSKRLEGLGSTCPYAKSMSSVSHATVPNRTSRGNHLLFTWSQISRGHLWLQTYLIGMDCNTCTCWRHMWVEFVVGSLPCSKRFFSGYSGFPLSLKTNTFKFQFDLERTDTFQRVLMNSLVLRG